MCIHIQWGLALYVNALDGRKNLRKKECSKDKLLNTIQVMILLSKAACMALKIKAAILNVQFHAGLCCNMGCVITANS